MAKLKLHLGNQVIQINYAWGGWTVRAARGKVKWLAWKDGCHRVRIEDREVAE